METAERNYLSFGGGVGSTALMLLLEDQGVEFEAVFVDHGTDLPETYEYVDYLRRAGHRITTIKPNFEGFSSLYEYCRARRFLPSVNLRWCTSRFKIRPILKYIKKPCSMFIGITYDERHRTFRKYRDRAGKGVDVRYPLVEHHLTRRDCVGLIKRHGLEVPPKSGCWICPFQSPRQLVRLYLNHRDLFERLVELERIRGNRHTLKERPVTYYVPWGTPRLERWLEGDGNG